MNKYEIRAGSVSPCALWKKHPTDENFDLLLMEGTHTQCNRVLNELDSIAAANQYICVLMDASANCGFRYAGPFPDAKTATDQALYLDGLLQEVEKRNGFRYYPQRLTNPKP